MRYFRRAASTNQYALIVGLIAVLSLAAITSAGSALSGLMTRTANTISGVAGTPQAAAPAAPGTYDFTAQVFTPCGATGQLGPSQASCRSVYNQPWANVDANFTVTGGIQLWTVPVTATYRIIARGAAGSNDGNSAHSGGLGAIIAGDFSLTAGTKLKIIAGQFGTTRPANSCAASGGGGSFVTTDANIPLIVAGGGGGASTDQNGVTASTGRTSTLDSTGLGIAGDNGSGGTTCGSNSLNGGGAGGFSGNGGGPSLGNGFSFLNGGNGGLSGTLNHVPGGFGGGGGTSTCTVGGGGGGGYSGAPGGPHLNLCGTHPRGGGGGGGSFVNNAGDTGPDASNISLSTGNTGDGSVSITKL